MADKTDGITYRIRIGRPIDREIVVNTYSVAPTIKGIPSEEMAEEITEKLNSVIPSIVKDAGGQLTIEGNPVRARDDGKNLKLSDVPVKLSNHEKTQKKVVEKARKRTKKLDQAVGA